MKDKTKRVSQMQEIERQNTKELEQIQEKANSDGSNLLQELAEMENTGGASVFMKQTSKFLDPFEPADEQLESTHLRNNSS